MNERARPAMGTGRYSSTDVPVSYRWQGQEVLLGDVVPAEAREPSSASATSRRKRLSASTLLTDNIMVRPGAR